jgi:hypothetical protein
MSRYPYLRRLPRDPTFDPAYIGNGVVAIGDMHTTIGPRGARCSSCVAGRSCAGSLGDIPLGTGLGLAVLLGCLFLVARRR